MESLNDYVPAFGPAGYVASRPHLDESQLRWIWRNHAARLIDLGAVIKPGRVLLAHPGKLDAFIIELGREQAKRGLRDIARDGAA
ncbi:MAG: hypothetical protein ING59_16640 [Burkholderiales bacterium]|nr:hypothetical protein [Burkholderiales bacterium]